MTVAPERLPQQPSQDGFSTSICDLFSDPLRKSDCCAITCCGLFVSDRTYFLALGKQPTPWWKRILINVVVPAIVCVALFSIKNLPRRIQILSLILVVIILLKRGQNNRAKVRQAVMERMNRIRQHAEGLQIDGPKLKQIHAPCTSFPVDETVYIPENRDAVLDGGDSNEDYLHGRKRLFLPVDLCSSIWGLSKLFCCGCFGCWIQCCGMCAVGQEDREMQLMLSKQELQIDYVTFEPYNDYFPKILSLRDSHISSFREHATALSKLSRYIVFSLLAFFLLFGVIAISHISEGITCGKLFVLIATFFQAFFVLYFVFWMWNRFDISFDAVVKYFSSGFLLCSGLALVFEVVVQILFGIIIYIFVVISMIVVVLCAQYVDENVLGMVKQINKEGWMQFALHHKEIYEWVSSVAAFSQAFLTAALVEELTKYFGYWMVEHPDFLPPEEMVDTAGENGADTHSPSWESYGSIVNTGELQGPKSGNVSADYAQHNSSQEERRKRLLSKRIAITVAMVTTATGFACFENLLYIFVYSPPGISNEIPTLVVRCIYPLHPIAAAIQSIGVIRRDLEGDTSYGVGRIILPAFLYHGLFDFTLMFLASLNKLKEFEESKKEQFDSSGLDIVAMSMLLSSVIFILGICYYVHQAHKQKKRLEELRLQ